MGKTCITRVASLAVINDCTIPVHGVKAIHLIPFEDVAGFTLSSDETSIQTFSLVQGGRNYKVEGFKQNIQYTEELVDGEYSDFIKPTVTFRKPARHDFVGNWYSGGIVNRKFVVFIVFNQAGKYTCLGLLNPMVVRAMERDSNANGGSTMFTLSTADGNLAPAIHDAEPLA